jgi:hypothetical protein
MVAARPVLIASILLVVRPAAAQSTADQGDVQRALVQLLGEDRVEKAAGAIAARHVIQRQWRFNLLARTELRWWQRELLPTVRPLVEMLADDAGLEWVNDSGATEQVTTPRKEATLALVGLERAAVEPLIAALARPELNRKADGVLRTITRGGPPDSRLESWQGWWRAHQNEPLPRERGQLLFFVLILLLASAAVAGVFFLQRKLLATRPRRGLSLSTAPPAASK